MSSEIGSISADFISGTARSDWHGCICKDNLNLTWHPQNKTYFDKFPKPLYVEVPGHLSGGESVRKKIFGLAVMQISRPRKVWRNDRFGHLARFGKILLFLKID